MVSMPRMKTWVTYGFIIALAGSLLGYVEFFLGYHNDPAKFDAGGTIGTIGGPIITIIGLFQGIRAVRESRPDRSLSYGRGVLAGIAIGIFAGLFGAISTYAYGTWVNPKYHELLRERQVAGVASRGLPDDQMALAKRMAELLSTPAAVAGMALFAAPFVGGLMSLVIAAILRRRPLSTLPSPHRPFRR